MPEAALKTEQLLRPVSAGTIGMGDLLSIYPNTSSFATLVGAAVRAQPPNHMESF